MTCCVSLCYAPKAPDVTRLGPGETDPKALLKHVRSTPASREHRCGDSDRRHTPACTGRDTEEENDLLSAALTEGDRLRRAGRFPRRPDRSDPVGDAVRPRVTAPCPIAGSRGDVLLRRHHRARRRPDRAPHATGGVGTDALRRRHLPTWRFRCSPAPSGDRARAPRWPPAPSHPRPSTVLDMTGYPRATWRLATATRRSSAGASCVIRAWRRACQARGAMAGRPTLGRLMAPPTRPTRPSRRLAPGTSPTSRSRRRR